MPAAKKKAAATKKTLPTKLGIELDLSMVLNQVRRFESDPETENYRKACETKLQEALVMLQNVRPL